MEDQRYSETVKYLQHLKIDQLLTGVILGTGLGGFVNEMQIELIIPYHEIPHFPLSTVESHSGKLVYGKIGNVPVVALQGRFHYYEGYSMSEVVYPVRILKLLGVRQLFISNASGGLNLKYKKGDLMLIEDHINLFSSNPLRGKHDPAFGPRFPDMSHPYDADLIHQAWQIAKQEKVAIHKGVYAGVDGPSLETRAEYKYLKNIGADVVGMSTIPEVIVARQMQMKVLAISVVTDECDPDNLKPVAIEEILQTAHLAEPGLTNIIKQLILNSVR